MTDYEYNAIYSNQGKTFMFGYFMASFLIQTSNGLHGCSTKNPKKCQMAICHNFKCFP